MKRVLIAYFSLSGNTRKMAEYIAEGVRFSGQEAVVKKISAIKKAEELAGYDGYIFGSPTFYRDIAEPMKTFLFLAKKAELEGKLAGAFGSYTHDSDVPAVIFDTMQYVFDMEPFELGSLKMLDATLQEPGRDSGPSRQYIAGEVHGESREGMRACQDYGRAFGERLGK